MATDILIVLIAAILAGLTALLLVANELGRRAKLSFPGRLALVGGLGFGVIAFTIKAGLVVYLGGLERQDIAALQAWRFRTLEMEKAAGAPEKPGEKSAQTEFGVWRALPLRVRDPRGNPATAEKVALGKELFFDRRLSADESLSCASCHVLAEGGDDNARFSTGINGLKGNRNAPTVLNAAFLSRLFWDGRAKSLEAQAKGPLVNPVEMGMPSLAAVEQKVQEIPAYQASFKQVFGSAKSVTIGNLVKAIAAYERTLITPDTPYDRFVRGDDTAMTKQQIRGMALFKATGCRNCHMDPTFSSAGTIKPFGTYRVFPLHPDNRFIRQYDLLVDGKAKAYRVPSLRNVALTAPYFHNGSVNSLAEAIRIMAVSQLGKKLSNRAEDDVSVTWIEGEKRRLTLTSNRALSDSEIADIEAFLKSLTGNLKEMD